MATNDPDRPLIPESDTSDTEERPVGTRDGGGGVRRRDFLHLGLASAAATASLRGTPTSAQAPAPGSGRGRARRQAASPQPTLDPTPLQPGASDETWIEPWVWRPHDWPGQQLHLNVVENENPGSAVGFGNPSAVLFSYGGTTPGPTIRMKGDAILSAKVRNLLGEDKGKTAVGPNPDPNELTPELDAEVEEATKGGGDVYSVVPAKVHEDFCLGEHTNGLHSAHVTNLHTHGLHVRPGRNPDGTHSDNVILRVIPQADFRRREARATDPACEFLRNPEQTTFLRDDEQAGEADYEFRLGDVQGQRSQPHPPGTFWYHPHSHGATHNQVSSGMAGFLIVEGDVDAAINGALTGDESPDPEIKQLPYDYRERLMLIQRVLNTAKDPDAPTAELRSPNVPSVNGNSTPKTITMRPGAIERWRVLNGSVDGRGYRRFMVLEGQYDVDADNELIKYNTTTQTFEKRSRQQVEDDKQQLYQLAMDGITLMDVGDDGRTATHTIRDLSAQNAGTENPLAAPPGPRCPPEWLDNPNGVGLCRYENVYRTGDSIRDTYVRPNEVYLAPANRCDVFFQAPATGQGGQVYTVLAHKVIVHADNPIQGLQRGLATGSTTTPKGPEQVIVAFVAVAENLAYGAPGATDPVPACDVMSLVKELPPVPDYLLPIHDEELAASDGLYRTRTIAYSGWGAADFPLIEVPDDFVDAHPELENLVFAPTGPDRVNVLLPAAIRTMAIDGKKFNPTAADRPKMWLDTAEEWVVYNNSFMLWGDTDPDRQPSYQFKNHYVSHPISRSDGQRRFRKDKHFQVVSKGVDHPFHIHQNPCWVTRIEIPDEHGELHNILDHPRWMDTLWIPRNSGRVVFRSRFPDYVGAYVNHCHLLLHEDNGMMQVIEVTPFEDQANAVSRDQVTSPTMSASDVSRLYPRLTPREAYVQSIQFEDDNPETGQSFPGFPVSAPTLDD